MLFSCPFPFKLQFAPKFNLESFLFIAVSVNLVTKLLFTVPVFACFGGFKIVCKNPFTILRPVTSEKKTDLEQRHFKETNTHVIYSESRCFSLLDLRANGLKEAYFYLFHITYNF